MKHNLPLTDIEKTILHHIRRWMKGMHIAPTRSELAIALGYKGDSAKARIHAHLKNMEKKGYIKLVPNKWRNIRIKKEITI